MAMPGLSPPKPIPLRDRSTLVFVERARLDVLDGAFVAINADGSFHSGQSRVSAWIAGAS